MSAGKDGAVLLLFDGQERLEELKGWTSGADPAGRLEEAARAVLRLEGIPFEEAEISVTFVSAEEIREINRDYRGVDSVTDVLSFPQFESPEEIPAEGHALLGDIVICLERIASQAEEYGHTPERELLYLFVHSLCHLLGYDHIDEEERRAMRAAEEAVMDELGLRRGSAE